MTHTRKSLVVGALLVALGTATAEAKQLTNGAAAGKTGASAPLPRALGGVAASNARLAVFIAAAANPRADFPLRSKGVASVTHPAAGRYCIRPSVAVNVHTLVPVVSVEWGDLFGNGNLGPV